MRAAQNKPKQKCTWLLHLCPLPATNLSQKRQQFSHKACSLLSLGDCGSSAVGDGVGNTLSNIHLLKPSLHLQGKKKKKIQQQL